MKFKEIRFKNILSYGNKFTTLNLDSKKSTIILGDNGNGKSVFLDAFHYVMTNKPFRKIKLTQLQNTTNKKNCLVELDLEDNGSLYTIRRGMNPNIFEIIKDGVSLNESSKTSDFQTVLENMCNFNPKNLRNTNIISSMGYKPFLEMTTAEKRLFLDDFLDMTIFTNMSKLMKQELSLVKDDYDIAKNSIETISSNLEIIKEMNEKAKINNDSEIEELKSNLESERIRSENDCKNEVVQFKKNNKTNILDEIKTTKEKIINLEEIKNKNIEKMENDIKEMTSSMNSSNDDLINNYNEDNSLHEKMLKLESIISKRESSISDKKEELSAKEKEHLNIVNSINEKIAIIKSNLAKETKQLKFIDDNIVCPKCNQKMDEMFKHDATTEIQSQIDSYNSELEECMDGLKKADIFKMKISTFKGKISILEKKLEENISELNDIKNDRNDLKFKRRDLKRSIDDCKNNIEYNEKKLSSIDAEYESDVEEINRLSTKKIDRLQDTENEQCKNIIHNFKQRYISVKKRIEEKINSLSNDGKYELKDENEILKKLLDAEQKFKEIEYKKECYEFSINLLSDKVIKSYIINKYIPILNKFINEYLDILESHYRLKFDENLNEQIVERGYEKLSYGSFSSGERARCNLSILFAFLELSRIKSSTSSNVIILDEVSDNSLDKQGISGILSIITKLKAKGYTPFIISHRDEIKNEFDESLIAKKDRFSELKEIEK